MSVNDAERAPNRSERRAHASEQRAQQKQLALPHCPFIAVPRELVGKGGELGRYGGTRALVLGYMLFRCGYWKNSADTRVIPPAEVARRLGLDVSNVYRARTKLRELGYLGASYEVTYRPKLNRNNEVPFLAVKPQHVRELGNVEALTLAQLEKFDGLQMSRGRVGKYMQVMGVQLRALIGCCKKTARRTLLRLAEGKPKRLWNAARNCVRAAAKTLRPRVELVKRGRGYATLVYVLSERECESARRPVPEAEEKQDDIRRYLQATLGP